MGKQSKANSEQGTTATTELDRYIEEKLEKAEELRQAFEYEKALMEISEASRSLEASGSSPAASDKKVLLLSRKAEIEKITGKWRSAMEALDKAISLKGSLHAKNELVNVFINKGELLSFQGEYAESIRFFEEALETAKIDNIPEECALSYYHLGAINSRMGDHQKGKELIEQCMELLKNMEETAEVRIIKAAAIIQVGLQFFRKGKFDDAVSSYERAITILEGREDSLEKAEAYRYIGVIHSIKSNYREALSYHQKALQIVSHVGYLFGMAKVYNSIGQLCLDVQKLDEALFFMGKTEKICTDLGADAEAATIYGKLGNVFMQKEDYENAVKYHLKDMEMCKRFGNNRALAYTYRNLGLSYFHIHQGKEAISYLREGLERFKELQDTVNMGRIYIDLCNAYLEQDLVKEADEMSRMALEVLEKYPQSSDIAFAKTLSGIIARKKKDYDGAYRFFTESMEILGWKEPTTRLIETHHELGLLYLEMKDMKKALVNFKIALRTARDMGLKKQVEKNLRIVEKIDEMEIVNIILEEL
ncbi:MAG: tetratricopeptide repeat protein [Candidatus Eremiobacteraeota bacterium]|nr:tetratricopeptide repeat protein [Candidatus Eremiobacteraeota bacterium]